MPDTKFSWARLRDHLRRYIWIYLAGIIVCLVGSNLLWTTTRPRIGNDESVIIYMAAPYSSYQAMEPIARDMLEKCQSDDARLKLVEFQSLQYSESDLDYTSSMLLITRLALGEGDAFLASEEAMAALVASDTLTPLDDIVADGWLTDYGLEPWYAAVEDEEAGETRAYMAGLRLDGVDALAQLGAFDNKGAFLCLSASSANPETTMRALEIMLEDLTGGDFLDTAEGL